MCTMRCREASERDCRGNLPQQQTRTRCGPGQAKYEGIEENGEQYITDQKGHTKDEPVIQAR